MADMEAPDYDAFHAATVPAALAAAQAYRDASGHWPHSLGREGHELARDVKQGRLWQMEGAPYEGVSWEFLKAEHRAPGPAGEAPLRWLWKAGRHAWTADIPEANAHAFLRALYDRFRDGGYAGQQFGGTLRKPPGLPDHRRLYRFFLDLDEHVADARTLEQHDAWVEACVGPLLEALWPGARWGWLRPTHARAEGRWERNADGVRNWIQGAGWKGGIHVHVDAWVDRPGAERAYNWIASMLRDQDAYLEGRRCMVGVEPGELELDPISWSAGPMRPNGTYKTVPCSPLLQTSKHAGRPVACPSACVRCRGSSVLLEGPAYWPRPEHDTLATFLLCSVAPPAEPAQPAPMPAWFDALMRSARGGRGTLLYSTGRCAILDVGSEAGRRVEDAVLRYFHRTGANALQRDGPLRLSWFRPDETSPPYLFAQHVGNTVCWFRSMQEKARRDAAKGPGKRSRLSPVAHKSSYNYWVFRADGEVHQRCRSEMHDCCRHGYRDGKPVLAWTGDRPCKPMTPDELRDVHGTAGKAATQTVAPPAGIFA